MTEGDEMTATGTTKGTLDHGDGDEYDLEMAEAEECSHPLGLGDEDDMDRKWDIDSDIDILLFFFLRPINDDVPPRNQDKNQNRS